MYQFPIGPVDFLNPSTNPIDIPGADLIPVIDEIISHYPNPEARKDEQDQEEDLVDAILEGVFDLMLRLLKGESIPLPPTELSSLITLMNDIEINGTPISRMTPEQFEAYRISDQAEGAANPLFLLENGSSDPEGFLKKLWKGAKKAVKSIWKMVKEGIRALTRYILNVESTELTEAKGEFLQVPKIYFQDQSLRIDIHELYIDLRVDIHLIILNRRRVRLSISKTDVRFGGWALLRLSSQKAAVLASVDVKNMDAYVSFEYLGVTLSTNIGITSVLNRSARKFAGKEVFNLEGFKFSPPFSNASAGIDFLTIDTPKDVLRIGIGAGPRNS